MIGDDVLEVIFGPVIQSRVDTREVKDGYVSIKVSPM